VEFIAKTKFGSSKVQKGWTVHHMSGLQKEDMHTANINGCGVNVEN